MKNTPAFLLILCFSLRFAVGQGAGAPETLKLTGIINLPERKCAVLEDSRRRHFILGEGQKDGATEVLQIDPEARSVKLRVSVGEDRTDASIILSLSQTNRITEAPVALMLDNADIEPVLALYSEFTQRTLLRPLLSAPPFTLQASAMNREEAGRVLQKALDAKEIASIPDGTKFLMVVLKRQAATVKPRFLELKSSQPIDAPSQNQAVSTHTPNDELIPSGAINFSNVDVWEVAKIYAELIGRKLDRTPAFSSGGPFPPVGGIINLKTANSLTKEEACYALETLFSWQGVKLVPVGNGLAKLVRISESGPGK
jgi:hypothetical protein